MNMIVPWGILCLLLQLGKLDFDFHYIDRTTCASYSFNMVTEKFVTQLYCVAIDFNKNWTLGSHVILHSGYPVYG